MYEQGVASGYTDNLFHPDRTVTRAEYLRMLLETVNVKSWIKGPLPFEHLSSHWAFLYLEKKGYRSGLILETDWNLVEPQLSRGITRAEAALLLASALELQTSDHHIENPFSDLNNVPPEVKDAILSLTAKGILKGMSPTAFNSHGLLTRGQASAIIVLAQHLQIKEWEQRMKLQATILEVKGDVSIVENGTRIPAQDGTVVGAGSEIETKDHSSATLKLSDGDILFIDSNSRISVKELNISLDIHKKQQVKAQSIEVIPDGIILRGKADEKSVGLNWETERSIESYAIFKSRNEPIDPSKKPVVNATRNIKWTDLEIHPGHTYSYQVYGHSGPTEKVTSQEVSFEVVKKASFKAWTGNVFAKVKNLFSSQSKFEIETPTTTAGVRGTSFSVETEPKETRVGVYSGAVALSQPDTGDEVLVEANKKATVKDDGSKPTLEDLDIKQSSEFIKKSLAKAILVEQEEELQLKKKIEELQNKLNKKLDENMLMLSSSQSQEWQLLNQVKQETQVVEPDKAEVESEKETQEKQQLDEAAQEPEMKTYLEDPNSKPTAQPVSQNGSTGGGGGDTSERTIKPTVSGEVKAGQTLIEGTAEPQAVVTLYRDGVMIGSSTVGSSGEFSIELIQGFELQEGDQLKLEAKISGKLSNTTLITVASNATGTTNISGTIFLPENRVAPAGGIPVTLMAFDGDRGHFSKSIVIPEGSHSAPFTLETDVIEGKYTVEYSMPSHYAGDQYVRNGYYSINGTTTDWNEKSTIDLAAGLKTGIDITLIEGNTISGELALPNGEIAPAGGLSIYISAYVEQHKKQAWNTITIPEGENSVGYTLTVPINTPGTGYYVEFELMDHSMDPGYVKSGYYLVAGTDNRATVDVSNGSKTGIDLQIIRGNEITGTILLPTGMAAPPGGLSVQIVVESSDHNMVTSEDVTIPANESSAPYAVVVNPAIADYRISYAIDHPLLYSRAFYSEDSFGMTSYQHKAAVLNGSQEDLAGIHLTMLKAYHLTGTLSLPNGQLAPAGGLPLDLIMSTPEAGYHYGMTIPADQNSSSFTLKVPEDREFVLRYNLMDIPEGSPYIDLGYYSQNGTTTDENSATIFNRDMDGADLDFVILVHQSPTPSAPPSTELSLTAHHPDSIMVGMQTSLDVNIQGVVGTDYADSQVKYVAVFEGLTADEVQFGDVSGLGTPSVLHTGPDPSLMVAWGPETGYTLADYKSEFETASGKTTSLPVFIQKAGTYPVAYYLITEGSSVSTLAAGKSTINVTEN